MLVLVGQRPAQRIPLDKCQISQKEFYLTKLHNKDGGRQATGRMGFTMESSSAQLPLIACARLHSGRTAIVDSEGVFTYDRLLDDSARVATALLEGRRPSLSCFCYSFVNITLRVYFILPATALAGNERVRFGRIVANPEVTCIRRTKARRRDPAPSLPDQHREVPANCPCFPDLIYSVS